MDLITEDKRGNLTLPVKEWQRMIYSDPGLRGKVIAIRDDRIVHIGKNYEDTISGMRHDKGHYSLFRVPRNIHNVRILSFKVRSFRKHLWIPTVPVTFCPDDSEGRTQEMLVDSGADISLVNHDFGRILGFERSAGEVMLEAGGIGGSVRYLLRKFAIEIENLRFENIFAWLQDDRIDEMIIGRETVFDLFDIEFRQAEEKVIFRQSVRGGTQDIAAVRDFTQAQTDTLKPGGK